MSPNSPLPNRPAVGRGAGVPGADATRTTATATSEPPNGPPWSYSRERPTGWNRACNPRPPWSRARLPPPRATSGHSTAPPTTGGPQRASVSARQRTNWFRSAPEPDRDEGVDRPGPLHRRRALHRDLPGHLLHARRRTRLRQRRRLRRLRPRWRTAQSDGPGPRRGALRTRGSRDRRRRGMPGRMHLHRDMTTRARRLPMELAMPSPRRVVRPELPKPARSARAVMIVRDEVSDACPCPPVAPGRRRPAGELLPVFGQTRGRDGDEGRPERVVVAAVAAPPRARLGRGRPPGRSGLGLGGSLATRRTRGLGRHGCTRAVPGVAQGGPLQRRPDERVRHA